MSLAVRAWTWDEKVVGEVRYSAGKASRYGRKVGESHSVARVEGRASRA